jgi:hypothetical protein
MDLPEILNRLGLPAAPTSHDAYLAAWTLVGEISKKLVAHEMTMRKALFSATFPTPKEGANTFVLATGAKLVATHKVTRTIDESQIALARSEYELVNDRPVAFDELLKASSSLVTSAYRKLEPAAGEPPSPAFLAASRMIVSKDGAPTLEVKS